MKALILGILIIGNIAFANDYDRHFVCGALKDRNGTVNQKLPQVKIDMNLVPMGPMLPAFNHVYTLILNDKTSGIEKVTMENAFSTLENSGMAFIAKSKLGTWVFIDESGMENPRHRISLMTAEKKKFSANCQLVDENDDDSFVVNAVKDFAQDKINSSMWVGAWVPKIMETKILNVQVLDSETKQYDLEITLDFGGPVAHQSKANYQALVKNQQVVDIQELE